MATDFQLSEQDYIKFRDLILTKSGLYFPEKKWKDLERGILEGLQNSSCKDLDAYYHLLMDPVKGEEASRELVSYLTVGETYFFRHFEVVEKYIIPTLIERKRDKDKKLRIWSAGCASGEEPYSLAILLHEQIPDLNTWDILILATDINQKFLKNARVAIYHRWALRALGDYYIQKYFIQQGITYKLVDYIKRMVTFDYHNLASSTYPSTLASLAQMDFILCRNVFIYFNLETTLAMMDRFYEALVDGGFLLMGSSEPSKVIHRKFKINILHEAVLYSKEVTSSTPELASDISKPIKGPTPFMRQEVMRQEEKSPLESSKRTSSPVIKEQPRSPTRYFGYPTPSDKSEKRTCSQEEFTLFQQSLNLFNDNQLEEALERFRQVLEINPKNARAHFMIAHIYANKGQLAKAKLWCERGLTYNPLLKEAYYLLSLIYREEGLYEEALKILKKILYLDIDHIPSHYDRILLYNKLGQPEMAKKSLEVLKRILEAKNKTEVIEDLGGVRVEEALKKLDTL